MEVLPLSDIVKCDCFGQSGTHYYIYVSRIRLPGIAEILSMDKLFRKAFDLEDDAAYQLWRQQKTAYCQPSLSQVAVDIADPFQLTVAEKTQILNACTQYNLVVYQLNDRAVQDKRLVSSLGKQLGLEHLDSNLRAAEDGISSLQVSEQSGNQYIPYTNKALSWHTDGYYNGLDAQINAIHMHCVCEAETGGVNRLLDHEFVYMLLRDENPAYIEALMHPQAMTIPANIDAGKEIRAAQTGPVFSLHQASGRLHMRYSARKRNILWREDAMTAEAVVRINEILATPALSLCVSLKPGQGVICNNVLHNRTGFTETPGKKRLLYRARYFERVLSY